MKKLIIIVILISASILLFAPSGIETLPIPEAEAIDLYLPVWEAVKFVEIGHLPDTTINYDEWAYGPGQIRQAKLEDFNLATGKNYTLRDCLKEPVAMEVFMWHCAQYDDIDKAIRRWNGSGPATYKYLDKVTAAQRNSIYLSAHPTDMGLGLRYDHRFRNAGIYSAVAYGNYRVSSSYLKNHIKASAGGIMVIPQGDNSSSIISVGIVYHHYGVLIDDYGIFTRRILKPVSIEIGAGGKVNRFITGFRMDILKWEGSFDFGYSF